MHPRIRSFSKRNILAQLLRVRLPQQRDLMLWAIAARHDDTSSIHSTTSCWPSRPPTLERISFAMMGCGVALQRNSTSVPLQRVARSALPEVGGRSG